MMNIRSIFYLPRVMRQFEKTSVNHPELGSHINDLRSEICYYLAAHKAAGIRFDNEHLEIIYSDGVTVILRQTLGIWIITRIMLTRPVREYRPVFGFKRVKEGAYEVAKSVLRCWRRVFDRQAALFSGCTGHPFKTASI